MATIRQLTTRFNFETDSRGVQNFRNVLGGMKKAVAGVAVALGAGSLAKAAADLGIGLSDAGLKAAQFNKAIKVTKDGVVSLTGEMEDSFQQVSSAIPGRVNMAPFLRSFVEFRQLLEKQPLEDFNTIFEGAGRIAVITGGKVEEVFKRLVTAATSGDFTPIQEIFPNFDVLEKSTQDFITKLLAVDPTGRTTIKTSVERFLKLFRAGAPELGEFSAKFFEESASAQFNELGRNIQAVGELMGQHLVGPMKDAATTVNDYLNKWIDGEKTLSGIFAEIGKSMREALDSTPLIGPLLRLVEKFGQPLQIEGKVERVEGAFPGALEEDLQDTGARTVQAQMGGGLGAQLEEARRARAGGREIRGPNFGQVIGRAVDALIGTEEERLGKVTQVRRGLRAREQEQLRRRGLPALEREDAERGVATPERIDSREGLAAPGAGAGAGRIEPSPPPVRAAPEFELEGPREPAKPTPATGTIIQNANVSIVIKEARRPRETADEVMRVITQASQGFPKLESAGP